MASQSLKLSYVGDATSLNNTLKSIDQSHQTLATSLKNIGSAIGIAFSVSAVISFAKTSLAAFDELEVATNRLDFALGKIGQEDSLPQVLDWAKSFASQTAINEQVIVDLSSKVAVLGQTFFTAVGPQATAELEKLTGGITNMAAATGKTTAMITKLMAPNILNVPEAAITSMQKYGILNGTTAQHVRDLVAAGKTQAATLYEINALNEKYAGAAANNATLTQHLSEAWNRLNIAVGGFVNNLLQHVVSGLGNMSPALKQLIGAVGLAAIALGAFNVLSDSFVGTTVTKMLIGLRALVVEFIFVADVEGVAAAGAGVFGAALGLLATPAVAFTLALAGVGLAIWKVKDLLDAAGKQGALWAQNILDGKNSVDQLYSAVQQVTGSTGLSDWFNGDRIALAAFNKTTDELITKLQATPGVLDAATAAQIRWGFANGDGATAAATLDRVMQRFNATLDGSRTHLDSLGNEVHNFAHMTTADVTKWRAGVVTAFDTVTGKITDLSGGFGKSANAVLKALQEEVTAAKRWARDMSVIMDSGLTEPQQKALLGNQALADQWVRGGAKIKATILDGIGSLKKYTDQTNTSADAIAKLTTKPPNPAPVVGAINTVTNALKGTTSQANTAYAALQQLFNAQASGGGGGGGGTGGGGRSALRSTFEDSLATALKLQKATADLVTLVQSGLKKGWSDAQVAQAKNWQTAETQGIAALQKLQTKLNAFKDSIVQGFSQLADLGGVVSALFTQTDASGNPIAVGAGDIAASIAAQVAQAQQLASLLQQVGGAGLSKDLLSQFASQGASAIPALTALLANPELIAQLNAASATIAAAAGTTASALGDQFFGKAIDQAVGKLTHLQDQLDGLVDDLRKDVSPHAQQLGRELEKLAQVIANITGAGGGGGGGGGGAGGTRSVPITINVNGTTDPVATASAVRTALLRHGQRNGFRILS